MYKQTECELQYDLPLKSHDALYVSGLREEVERRHVQHRVTRPHQTPCITRLCGGVATHINHSTRSKGEKLSEKRIVAATARWIQYHDSLVPCQVVDLAENIFSRAAQKLNIGYLVVRCIVCRCSHRQMTYLYSVDLLEVDSTSEREQT